MLAILQSKYILWWAVLIIPIGIGITLYFLDLLKEFIKERNI